MKKYNTELILTEFTGLTKQGEQQWPLANAVRVSIAQYFAEFIRPIK